MEKNYRTVFGNYFKKVLRDNDITQKTIADLLDIRPQYLHRIVTGERVFNQDQFDYIYNYFSKYLQEDELDDFYNLYLRAKANISIENVPEVKSKPLSVDPDEEYILQNLENLTLKQLQKLVNYLAYNKKFAMEIISENLDILTGEGKKTVIEFVKDCKKINAEIMKKQ